MVAFAASAAPTNPSLRNLVLRRPLSDGVPTAAAPRLLR